MKIVNKILIIIAISVFSFSSCSESFFDVRNDGVVTDKDIEDLGDDEASQQKVTEALLTGIYSYLYQYNTQGSSSSVANDFGLMSIYHLGDVMNNDLAFHVRGSGWFTFDYELDYWSAQYVRPYFYWNFFYSVISKANAVIAALDLNSDSEQVKAGLGQAYAFRAMSHFYLVQMYQQTYKGNETQPGIPIIRVDSKEDPSVPTRASLEDVYTQIDNDFIKALGYLDLETWKPASKVYMDRQVVAGLYSRVCLVKNDWDNAIKYAQIARAGKQVLTIEEMKAEGFNDINSKEWIWGSDITAETTTMFGSFFSFVCSYDAGYGGDVGQYRKIDAKLYSYMRDSDVRKYQFKKEGFRDNEYTAQEKAFPDYTNLKFKKVEGWTADYVYMRTPEMILTEAEAWAHKGDGAKAASVLKELMVNRDPSWNEASVSWEQVYIQRRLELWAEGFSLFDHLRLKQGIDRAYAGTNHLSSARYKISSGSWYFLFQLPLREIDNNDDLSQTDQNPAPTGSKFE